MYYVKSARRAWWVAVLAAVSVSLGAGCQRDEPLGVPDVDAGSALPEFVNEGFDRLYPVFLLRKIQPGVKAALWNRYHHKWVRWTGRLVSFTPNGITVRHIPSTVTFDASVWIEPSHRAALSRLKPGELVTYVGRLDSYDDVFRTFYLVHGDVASAASSGQR